MLRSLAKKLFTGILMSGSFFSAPLILILLGPPGSGKGTQAALIHDKFHIPHISTGDLLREHIRKETELGKQAKIYMDKGLLVPDELIFDMLFDRVSQKDCSTGYILDGFPRTLAQAEVFQAHLQGKVTPVVINLDLSDAKIIERLSQRVSCERCGTPYHLTYSPPKTKGICDKCQGKLIQRSDDKEEVIIKRLKVYHEQTKPLIHFYTQRKLLHTIDCNDGKEHVFSQVISLLPPL